MASDVDITPDYVRPDRPAGGRKAQMEQALKSIKRLGKVINAVSRVSPWLAGRMAFRLFCTPRRQPLRDKDKYFLKDAVQHTLEFEHIPVRVYEWPSKGYQERATVLFLHGWESNSARWQKHVKCLTKAGFCVHAFDAPGHGASGGRQINLPLFSRTIVAYMKQFGAPYAMIGHSLGGAAVIMSMAAFDAPRVKKAVVMAPFAETSRVLEDFGQILGLRSKVVQQMDEHVARVSGMPIRDYSIVRHAALLTDVSGLVIHDLNDEVAPVAEGRAVAEAWQADYLETAGLGHRMQDKKIVEAVLAFLG